MSSTRKGSNARGGWESLLDQHRQMFAKSCRVASEAVNHGRKERFRLQVFHHKPAPGSAHDQSRKCQLRPTISFAEGVDGIQLHQKSRNTGYQKQPITRPRFQIRAETAKQGRHLRFNEFGITEYAPALEYPNLTIPAGPGINVSEYMTMNSAVVLRRKFSRRKNLSESLRRHLGLECVEARLIPQAESILENGGPGVAVGVTMSAVQGFKSCSCAWR